MGREHEPDVVWQAQSMYCCDRMTFEQIAKVLTPSASTLKRWAAKFNWRGKREEIAQAEANIRGNTVLARAKMLESLIDTQDPQAGFAVASLEKLALEQARAARAGELVQARMDAPRREIRTQEDAAVALKEAVELKLAAMLADPAQVDFKAITGVRQALELVRGMQAQDKDGKPKPDRGLSEQTAREIKKLLGYKP